MKKKMFLASWGRGYSPSIRKVDATFFNEENGYDKEDVEAVGNLEVGEDWCNSDPSGTHIVIRLQDDEVLQGFAELNLDTSFTDAPGELGEAWRKYFEAENALALMLERLPDGSAVTLGTSVWFLDLQKDGRRVLCHANLRPDGYLSEISSRLDFDLMWVDVCESDLANQTEMLVDAMNDCVFVTFDLEKKHVYDGYHDMFQFLRRSNAFSRM